MSIQIAYTDHGTIIGDFEQFFEGHERYWECNKPVVLQPHGEQLAMFPLLALAKEHDIKLKESDVKFGGLFTPPDELRNQYNSQFGSGIQVATKGPTNPPPGGLLTA